MDSDTVALSILIVGEASGVFAGFCPSWFTVSSPFFHEQEAKSGNIKRIRWGEIAASTIVIATGAAVSKVSDSKVPLYVSLASCAVFVGGYEYMIAHPATEDSKAPTTFELHEFPSLIGQGSVALVAA